MGIELGWDEWEKGHLILDERLTNFSRWVKNFVLTGYGLVNAGGLILNVGGVGLNVAYANGYEIKQTGPTLKTLAPSATSHVFLKFVKTPDPLLGTKLISISIEVNTTAIPPANSIKLGEADTNATIITAIRPQNNKLKVHDAQLETDLDCNQLQLKRFTAEKGTAFPTSPAPVIGEHFVRTDQVGNPEYRFDGTTWVVLGAGSGAQGAQGPQGFGIQGAQGGGPQGSQGPMVIGVQGPQGLVGSMGNQGLRGFQGFVGVGLYGPQGWQGNQGHFGCQGFQGNQGWQGWQGNQGNQGFQGLQGAVIMASGTYVGDGTNDRTIATGFPFPPKRIDIFNESTGALYSKTDTMAAKLAIHVGVGTIATVAIVVNDFTVDNIPTNSLGTTYDWVAWA
jgi:hypothetical protein